MNKLEWRNPKNKLPKDNQVVLFKLTDSIENWVLAGIYVEAEKMFFIGFEQVGDFKYSFDVLEWIPISEVGFPFNV